jgi:hypothetical protein
VKLQQGGLIMYGLFENIVVAVIVLAVLGKTGWGIYKALKNGRADNIPACTGNCASCRTCGNHLPQPLDITGLEGKQQGRSSASSGDSAAIGRAPRELSA